MRNRSIIQLLILTIITFGIYRIYWLVSTKNEMNQRGADIPTTWLIIVPLVNFWWMWKYSEGVERVVGARLSAPIAFLLQLALGLIGDMVIQYEFNRVGEGAPEAPLASVDTSTPVA